jgi:tight adherence protein B
MNVFVAVLLTVWIAAFGLWWGLSRFVRTSDAERIKNRLAPAGRPKNAKADSGQPSLLHEHREGSRVIQHLLTRYNLMPRLQELLEQAGLKWHPVRLVHGCLLMFMAVGALTWLVAPPEFRRFALLTGAGGATLPILYVLRVRSARLKRFEEIFPDSLEFVARSMRAGHAFSVSLEMIHREFQEPLAGEFRRTFEEHNLGIPLEVALQKLARRVPSLDVHFFVSAVLLQKRTGGNLAEILDKLAYIIRERFKLRGRIRAISAHGRMTGTALTLIPCGVAVLMFFANPEYIRFFFLDRTGNYLIAAAAALQLVGYAIIRKIVAIEV